MSELSKPDYNLSQRRLQTNLLRFSEQYSRIVKKSLLKFALLNDAFIYHSIFTIVIVLNRDRYISILSCKAGRDFPGN